MDPSPPLGYDRSYAVSIGRNDCHVTVGFDQHRGQIVRFLVQLHYLTGYYPLDWTQIARFDHNEVDTSGHDIYNEGLHIDIERHDGTTITLHPPHRTLPRDRGVVIGRCVTYFQRNADDIIAIYKGTASPGTPSWPP